MLETIKIEDIASYDVNGIQINELKKINFFYGANGCGKTTISEYLTNPLPELNSKFNSCSVMWSGGIALQTLVYNKSFRDNNFTSGNIAGIFTLGEATAEDIQNIADKKIEQTNVKDLVKTQKITVEGKGQELENKREEFTLACWKVYLNHKDNFKEALKGGIGSKKDFAKNIFSRHNAKVIPAILSHEKLLAKGSILLGQQPQVFSLFSTVEHESLQRIETDDIWHKVIVGKKDIDISTLINRLGSSDWVNFGRSYLSSINDGTCPFCQKETIDEEFKDKLESYFDESFTHDNNQVKTTSSQYKITSDRILALFNNKLNEEKQNVNTKLNVELFAAYLTGLEGIVSANVILTQQKVDKASQVVDIKTTINEIQALNKLLDSANKVISEHNKLAQNYTVELANYKNEVWNFIANELKTESENYLQISQGLRKAIENIENSVKNKEGDITRLDREIKELSKNVTSVQPTVIEINRMLKAYGFYNFEIVPSTQDANYYTIQRENGEPALNTLSEGEITFITFLYFVQLAKGALTKEGVTEDRILIIDDPISSLDSNVLYIVSAIVKDLIKDIKDGTSIKQLLLLTHNIYFHKEASFQNGRSNGDKNTHFWIIRKNQKVSSIQAYEQKNPIESSYELLWRELKDWQNSSGITLQNTMRRILENYFKILGGFKDEDFVKHFATMEEQQICQSLLYWINDGSHCLPDDLFIQSQEQSIECYLEVFKKIFEYSKNIGHYEIMMGVYDVDNSNLQQNLS